MDVSGASGACLLAAMLHVRQRVFQATRSAPEFMHVAALLGNDISCSQTTRTMQNVPELQQRRRAGLHLLPTILSATTLMMQLQRRKSEKRLLLQRVSWMMAAQTAKARARARARPVHCLPRMMTRHPARLREKRRRMMTRRGKGRRSDVRTYHLMFCCRVTGWCALSRESADYTTSCKLLLFS